MNLYGRKVILRPIEEEDLEMIRELTNDPNFEKVIVGWSFPVSKQEQAEWFREFRKDSSRLRYIIASKEGESLGMIELRDLDWKNGSADACGMRIFKGKKNTQGLAADAWMTFLRYAFNELRLNRIGNNILEYNLMSQKIYESVGFKFEGRKRKAIYKNGKFNDLIVMGCLKSDYEELIASNHYWEED